MFFKEKALERLLRFDTIRILKITEILQYSVLAFIFSLILGPIINKIMPTFDEKKGLIINCIETLLHISIIIIVVYYLRKFVPIFPFIIGGAYTKYIPSMKKESLIGTTIGIGYIFNKTQDKLVQKIKFLTKYFH